MPAKEDQLIQACRKIEESLPYPLAVSLKRYRDISPDRYSERIDTLLKAGEVIIKLLAAIAAKSFLLDGAPDDNFRRVLRGFRSPSIGEWVGLLRASLKPYEKIENPPVIELIRNWYSKGTGTEDAVHGAFNKLCNAVPLNPPQGKLTYAKVIDLLVSYRNKGPGHGSRVTDEEYKERLEAIEILLITLAEGLVFLEDFPLCYVDEVKVKGGEYYHTLRVGLGKDLERKIIKSKEPLQDLRLYLFGFDNTGNPTYALDLSPFVILKACPTCKMDQFFFYNSTGRNVEYISYQCGHFLNISDPSGEFSSIEDFLADRLSLYNLFHGKTLGREIEPEDVATTRENRQKATNLAEIAQGMQRKGLFKESFSLANKALSLNPDSSEAHLVLGMALLWLGEPGEQVLETLENATRLNPDSAQAQFALGRAALFFEKTKTATEALANAQSLDPANQVYRSYVGKAGGIAGHEKPGSAGQLARELVADQRQFLPQLRWWVTALPPWSWIDGRHQPGSIILSIGFLTFLLVTNYNSLDTLNIYKFLNMTLLVYVGLIAPFYLEDYLIQLYNQLRSVVTLPPDIFRRWFLTELVTLIGSYHMLEDGTRYTVATTWSRDRFHYLMFIVGLVLFALFQTICAVYLDPFSFDLAGTGRWISYFLEIYLLAWVPGFVVSALIFIPVFSNLPIRHFIDMPDSVSLKPLGTFYLKIASLGSIAFILFTVQHYLFRTHEAIPLTSIIYIIVVYTLFFAIMFASQGVIMATMARLREKRLIEYSRHLESAFQNLMRNPSEAAYLAVAVHRKNMKILRKGLSISGFTFWTLMWFLALSVIEIAIMAGYIYLVSNKIWQS